MQWPDYLPYPIAFVRAGFQLTAIAAATRLIIGSNNLEEFFPLFILSPFGLVSFLLIPIVMMTVFHWIFRNILHQLKGIPKPKVIESLWEGIYGWMVAIFSCTLTTFLFVVPTFMAFEVNPVSGQYIGYLDDDEFLLSCLIIYSIITLYLYHLEHLMRFPIARPNVKRSPKSRQQPVTEPQSPQVPPTQVQGHQRQSSASKKAIPVTPDEIELELEQIKKNQRNNNRNNN